MPTHHPFRRDKGLILATKRDIRVLTQIAHHGIARHDHIWQMLAAEPGGQTLAPGQLAASTVKDIIDRWRRAGWVEYRRVLANESGYAYVLKDGLRLVGLDDLYPGRGPAEMRYHHYWAVMDVWLNWWLKAEDPEERAVEWIPERRLRAEALTVNQDKHPDYYPAFARHTGHGAIPDAIAASLSGQWVDAIEIQLTPLKPSEMQDKLEKLSDAVYWHVEDNKTYLYNQIHFYVPTASLKRHISHALKHLDERDQARFDVVIEPRFEAFVPVAPFH